MSYFLSREAALFLISLHTYDDVKRYFLSEVERSGYYRRLLSDVSASFIGLLFVNWLDIKKINAIANMYKDDRSVVDK